MHNSIKKYIKATRVKSEATAEVSKLAASVNLNAFDLVVLSSLADKPRPGWDIAETCATSAPSISRTIVKLLELKMVKRQKTDDIREKRFTLTAKGNKALLKSGVSCEK